MCVLLVVDEEHFRKSFFAAFGYFKPKSYKMIIKKYF